MERTSLVGIDRVDNVFREMRIETAVVATFEEDAQQAVDKLVSVPPGIADRDIDLAGGLIASSRYRGYGQNDAWRDIMMLH